MHPPEGLVSTDGTLQWHERSASSNAGRSCVPAGIPLAVWYMPGGSPLAPACDDSPGRRRPRGEWHARWGRRPAVLRSLVIPYRRRRSIQSTATSPLRTVAHTAISISPIPYPSRPSNRRRRAQTPLCCRFSPRWCDLYLLPPTALYRRDMRLWYAASRILRLLANRGTCAARQGSRPIGSAGWR